MIALMAAVGAIFILAALGALAKSAFRRADEQQFSFHDDEEN